MHAVLRHAQNENLLMNQVHVTMAYLCRGLYISLLNQVHVTIANLLRGLYANQVHVNIAR